MDGEDDTNIFYSLDNLNNLMENAGLTLEAAIERYLKDVNHKPVEDFKDGLEWFNVSEPVKFSKHLKGKIVVLDFFTYCCINCMHILPDLKALEEKFSIEDGLVVVGVHSAKFANEKLSSNILSAVQRYNITHPVVNDSGSDMWRKCDVHCWPTLLVLGPNANPLMMLMGEGHKDVLNKFVEASLRYYKNKKAISGHALPVKSAFCFLPELKGPLLFPGKVCAFGDLIAISDSGNSRVLVVDRDGYIVHKIGGKRVGFKDGDFERSELNQPQGVCFLDENTLFVADTENHAIRRVDLREKTVTTVAGNGIQGGDHKGGNIEKTQPISSPWDVCVIKNELLLIAMAGTHQIWGLFLQDCTFWKGAVYKKGQVVALAGSSREENKNNDYPMNAGFAQPSGLAFCRNTDEVFIADSEGSTIRKLSMVKGKVSAVVGGDRNPNNLFAFGDKDGTLNEAKLQHALGVTTSPDGNSVYVTDTYNHKIKRIDISTNTITTMSYSSEIREDDRKFNEPSGLCFSPSQPTKLYVADTNNHRVKVLSLNTHDSVGEVSVLKLRDKSDTVDSRVDKSRMVLLNCTPSVLSLNGGKAIVKVSLFFENGLSLTAGAPNKWYADVPNLNYSCTPNSGVITSNFEVVINVIPGNPREEAVVDLVLSLITCKKEVCLPKNFIIRVPFKFEKQAGMSLEQDVKVVLDPAEIKLSSTH